MRARTLTRLCDRQKFGMVGVRTVSLSQLRAIPARGLQRDAGTSCPREVQARPFLRDVERPSLNLGNFGSRRTSGGPVGAANAKVRR